MLKENLSFFLVGKLELLALNQFETNDFIQFWLPFLEQSERNCIRFSTNSHYEVFSENIDNPSPDNTIRVFMDFYKAGKNIKIEPQIFNKVDRKGFVLTEWSGSDISKIINAETTYKPVEK